MSFEDLPNSYFVNHIFDDPDGHGYGRYVHSELNGKNVKNLLNNNICSFTQLVDRLRDIKDPHNHSCLDTILWDNSLFKNLIKNNLLIKEDLKYLLNKLNGFYELDELCCRSACLLKYILSEFVLDKELVDKFNKVLEKDNWCKTHNIYTIFDLIEFYEMQHKEKLHKELLKLNEMNKYTYCLGFDDDQKDRLIELIKNNENAKNKLRQIVENNLESNYDFESLMNYLKKAEKKSILNI